MRKNLDYNEAFGNVVREYRLSLKKSQDTLAAESELDRTYVSLLELGRRSPTLDVMVNLCRALSLQFPLFAHAIEDERLRLEDLREQEKLRENLRRRGKVEDE